MEDELYLGAACPAADLTARLLSDLRRAEVDLARVDELFAAASNVAAAALEPRRLRRERRTRLQHVQGLRQALLRLHGDDAA
jgi:hypothetical protein